MIGAPNSLNLNCKVRVMKEAPGPSVSEEIADIFTNYNIDIMMMWKLLFCMHIVNILLFLGQGSKVEQFVTDWLYPV